MDGPLGVWATWKEEKKETRYTEDTLEERGVEEDRGRYEGDLGDKDQSLKMECTGQTRVGNNNKEGFGPT